LGAPALGGFDLDQPGEICIPRNAGLTLLRLIQIKQG